MSRTKLSAMFIRDKKRREIDRALTVHEHAGHLRREIRQPGRGRHDEVWIAVTAHAA